MKIDKAIELLGIAKVGWPVGDDAEDYYKALELGIEALKFRLRLEKSATYLKYKPLPGETE